MKNKIVIHGSQYKDNFGDTLLVKVIQDNLGDEFDVYSSTASDKVLNNLKIKKANKMDMITAKYFIYGGGGYFGQPNSNINKWSLRFIVRHGIIGVCRRLLSKRYIFIGTGFGPLTHPVASKIARFILNGADSVNLRDAQSIEYAKKLAKKSNLNETADLVPGYISKNFSKQVDKKIILHMHIPNGDYVRLNRILHSFIEFRNEKLKGYSIEIISDSENDEQQTWFFDDLKCNYPELIISPYKNFEDTINNLSKASFVVTNKLHVAIVSVSMGISVASIFMHNKTQRFFEQLNRPYSAMSLDSVDDSSNLKVFFDNAFENGLDDEALNYLIKKSDMNLAVLNKWVGNE